jgi:hypothetical protein
VRRDNATADPAIRPTTTTSAAHGIQRRRFSHSWMVVASTRGHEGSLAAGMDLTSGTGAAFGRR